MNELRNRAIRSAITNTLNESDYTTWYTIRRSNPHITIETLREVMRELVGENIVEKKMDGSRAGYRLVAVE